MPNENELSSIFKEFWPSNWNKKEDGEKVESCQKLENYLAAENGRSPYEVRNYYNKHHDERLIELRPLGKTIPLIKTIEVQMKGVTNGFTVLRTLAYESAKADQHELIKTMEKAKRSHKDEMEYKEALKRNELSETDVLVMKWEHKNIPHPTILNNELQHFALDARQRSLKFLTKNYTRMGEEEGLYQYPQIEDYVKTNFKNYLETIGEYEFRRAKQLVNDPEVQAQWLSYRREKGMFDAETTNNLNPVQQEKLRDVFLNDRGSISDFKVFNKIRTWETEKTTYLKEAEKLIEAKAKTVTLEELEGKQQKKNNACEKTMVTPAKAKCSMTL